MSKSCCSTQHAAAPIKAVSKASSTEHQHNSHCCDNAAPVSCCGGATSHDHQDLEKCDSPGDEEPP